VNTQRLTGVVLAAVDRLITEVRVDRDIRLDVDTPADYERLPDSADSR
jgi:CTP:molybdopterin cytidylyltransferase MocA